MLGDVISNQESLAVTLASLCRTTNMMRGVEEHFSNDGIEHGHG